VKVLSVAEMRICDQNAVKKRGYTSLLLMEQAAQAFARIFMDQVPGEKRITIVTGKGNNGGDGWAVGRILHVNGYDVRIFPLMEPVTEEGLFQQRLALNHGITVLGTSDFRNCEVIIDAVFGTGFQGELPEEVRKVFRKVSSRDLPIWALDIPSGVNGDTGVAAADALKAQETVTFEYPKYGHFINDGRILRGKLTVVPIGVRADEKSEKEFQGALLSDDLLSIPDPPADTHKYDRGAVQVIGGAEPYTGAPLLASLGALRSGAGYVVTDVLYRGPVQAPAEFIVRGHENFQDVLLHDKCAVHLIGPGLGRSEEAKRFLTDLFEKEKGKRFVLDADALFFFDQIYRKGVHEVIVTPHLGEFSQMTGVPADKICEKMIPLGQSFAREKECVLILKSHGTVIFSPDGSFSFNPAGNSFLATMGSGDILSGVVAALWARGLSREEAASAGVLLHSRAGDRLVEGGEVNFTASGLAAAIPKVIKRG